MPGLVPGIHVIRRRKTHDVEKCRMGRAKRNPSSISRGSMGFASLYPSYDAFAFVAGNNEEANRAMTADGNAPSAAEFLPHHLPQNPPFDTLVGQRCVVPPPAVALH